MNDDKCRDDDHAPDDPGQELLPLSRAYALRRDALRGRSLPAALELREQRSKPHSVRLSEQGPAFDEHSPAFDHADKGALERAAFAFVGEAAGLP